MIESGRLINVEARRDFPGQGLGSQVTHFAFDFIRIQQVNENFEAAYIPNGQLARLLHQTEVHQGTKGENSGCLVASLQSGWRFNGMHEEKQKKQLLLVLRRLVLL